MSADGRRPVVAVPEGGTQTDRVSVAFDTGDGVGSAILGRGGGSHQRDGDCQHETDQNADDAGRPARYAVGRATSRPTSPPTVAMTGKTCRP